ncbi:FxSxx-COOH system tetratricopeptide repeat protein [Streptomyces sp. NPDC002088]|uniref:FxSxx-COOH system tetratricopeptide repeat protein n=1 Tax=Streptomyces sp. NPDC002088 TaxID=3154665 RepID=UPI00331A678A
MTAGPLSADPSLLGELAARLGRLGVELSARELAEALWLARYVAPSGTVGTREEPTRAVENSEESTSPFKRRRDPESQARTEPVPAADRPTRLYPEASRPESPDADAPRDDAPRRVHVPIATALPRPLELQRALRPLQRYHPPVRAAAHDVDEQATAERAADTGLLMPVLRPVVRRAARLRLLMDVSTSTFLWDKTLEELSHVCAGTGAFREVLVHYVHEGTEGPDGSLLIGASRKRDRTLRAVEQVRDPTGHQLTLVLSDCAGPQWSDGRMQRLLCDWAQAAPVAVVQPLPQRMWRRTHLPAVSGTLRRREGLGARLECTFPGGELPHRALPVPVLGLTPTAFGAWARLVSGSTGLALPAAVGWVRADHPAAAARSSSDTPDPEELVRSFRGTASNGAVQLAVSLSAVPLTVPVMQLVQRAMLPETGPSVLAEVLLSGLLRRGPEEGWYEFRTGVREVLLRLLPKGDALLVLKHCGDYVDRHFGRRARNFPALALAELTGGKARRGLEAGVPRAFAEVSKLVARRYGATGMQRTTAAEGRRATAQGADVVATGPADPHTVVRPDSTHAASNITIVFPGYHRSWAVWIAYCLERQGQRCTLHRWDPPRNVSLEDSLGDLLLASGRILLVLNDWFFELGPRLAGEWNDALRGFIAAHADRFAAVNLTNRTLLPATAVLEPASLWGLNEEAAEERLLSRLGLERRRRPRRLPARVRYPETRCEIWGEVPRRNPRFTGRDDLLYEIHRRLADAERGASACTLLGMSGIGKTQLATEYAHRFSTDYDLVWWVNSDDRNIQRDRLGELTGELGLNTGSEPGERIRAVRDALRRGEPYSNWLVVFDGWDNLEGVHALLPQGPGHVLVTSRNRLWSEHTDILEVPAFLRSESIGYLMRRAPHITAEEADQVAAEFGDVPLPLVQAASWLGESGMDVPEYLGMVHEGRLSTIEQPATGDGFPQSSMTSWSILLNRLRRAQPQTTDVLSLCVSFAPGHIPLGLIRAYPQADLPEELRWMTRDLPAWTRALDTLVNYSVLTRESRGSVGVETGLHQESVHMHRLVHDIVSKLTSEESRANHRKAVRTLLAEADPGTPADSRNWPRYAELLPHLEPSGALDSARGLIRDLVLNCLRYSFLSGEYRAGRELAQRVRDHWSETMDPLTQPMLDLADMESAILRADGRFHEAYERDRGVLERLEAAPQRHALGELTAKGGTASGLRYLGRYEEAYELQREVLDSAGSLLGPDAIPTLVAQHDTGVGLGLLGRYAEAYELGLETLGRRERVLGARHIHTLDSGNAVSHSLRLLGRYRDALARQEPVVRLHVQVLGPQHPQTLAARVQLVMSSCSEGGQAPDVGTAMASLLEQLEQLHGREHYRTLSFLTNYGNYLREHGNLGQARDLIVEAEAGLRALLGPAHPVATGMLSNTGLIMQSVGERAEAMAMFEAAFAGLTATVGPDHPWALGCALNAASGRNVNGRIADAVELSRDTLRRARYSLGDEHPLTLSAQVALAADLRAAREREEAGKLEEDGLVGLTRTLGAQHPHTVSARQRSRPYWDFEPYLG